MATSHIDVAPNSIITLPSSFITMVGTSYDLPLNVRCTIPQQIPDSQLRRCPVVSGGRNQHVLFSPDGLFPHRLRQVALDGADHEEDAWVGVEPTSPKVQRMWFVPGVGSYCRLVLPDQRRFMGRITRVVEYQQTRIILWVEHPYSPASITLAVPYSFYEGTQWWYIWLRRLFGYLQPDENNHHSGKCIWLSKSVYCSLGHSHWEFTQCGLVGAG